MGKLRFGEASAFPGVQQQEVLAGLTPGAQAHHRSLCYLEGAMCSSEPRAGPRAGTRGWTSSRPSGAPGVYRLRLPAPRPRPSCSSEAAPSPGLLTHFLAHGGYLTGNKGFYSELSTDLGSGSGSPACSDRNWDRSPAGFPASLHPALHLRELPKPPPPHLPFSRSQGRPPGLPRSPRPSPEATKPARRSLSPAYSSARSGPGGPELPGKHSLHPRGPAPPCLQVNCRLAILTASSGQPALPRPVLGGRTLPARSEGGSADQHTPWHGLCQRPDEELRDDLLKRLFSYNRSANSWDSAHGNRHAQAMVKLGA